MLIGNQQIILMFLVLFLILAFTIGQVVWIFLDSKKRQDKWTMLRAILALTLIFSPILLPLPLIVYLLLTRAISLKCPNCKIYISNNILEFNVLKA